MIGSQERIALVVMKEGIVKTICYLGFANLESGEEDRLSRLARARGCNTYLVELEETVTYAQLYQEVEKALT